MIHKSTITPVTWKEVRHNVVPLNNNLAKIIDSISPAEEDPLYLAQYCFGDTILSNGKTYLPTQHANQSNISAELSYRFVPMGLMLNGSAEIYFDTGNRLVSINYLTAGDFFGLWEAMDPLETYYIKNIWSISSGARSLFLLPKITNTKSNKQLQRKYNLNAALPKTPKQHWDMLKQIANSEKFEQTWALDVLYFPKRWMQAIKHDSAWKELKTFLLETSWGQVTYWRNKVTFDFVWELYSSELYNNQQIKLDAYLFMVAKHLILVAVGVIPGFKLCDDSDTAGPISGLRQAYLDDYNIKPYWPAFCQPSYLTNRTGDAVYISLQFPTWLEAGLSQRSHKTLIKSTDDIEFIIKSFQDEIKKGKYQMDNTFLEKFINNIKLTFFNLEADNYDNPAILSSARVIELDPFVRQHSGIDKGYEFPHAGPFMRACVKIERQ